MFTKSLLTGLVSLLIFAVNAWASPAILEGTVKDANGQALKGADVRIESAAKGSNFSNTVKTDAKGHYVSGPLAQGNYRVTLLVNGAVKASINNANAKLGEATQLNFSLKKEAIAQANKKSTHMVYIPGETGSHLGGRWVEVDGAGNPVGAVGADSVQKAGNDAIRNMQATGH